VRGDSDTEVLLEACALWGVEAAIERSIACSPSRSGSPDPHPGPGARSAGHQAALLRGDAGPVAVRLAAQGVSHGARLGSDDRPGRRAGYLRHGYVQQPRSIYREAAKLPPGHILTCAPGIGAPKCFWDLRGIAAAGVRGNDPTADPNEAVEHLDKLLRDSVRLRMIADVPLGAFLSGASISSTVVALMQAQSTRPVKTFSIGFHEAGFDEARTAKAVAAHLGTEHTEFYVEAKHALDVIPRLPEWFDEPFADPSEIPTYIVSELTRNHVTVALSGDGGDELFAGYERYGWAERLVGGVNAIPRMLHGPRRRHCERCRPRPGPGFSAGCRNNGAASFRATSCTRRLRYSMIRAPAPSTPYREPVGAPR